MTLLSLELQVFCSCLKHLFLEVLLFHSWKQKVILLQEKGIEKGKGKRKPSTLQT